MDFTIHAGEVFGLVGESGSNWATIGRAMAGLEAVTGGSLTVFGHEMRGFRERRFRPLRREIGFVFQDPATSFDPQLTIGNASANRCSCTSPVCIRRLGASAWRRCWRPYSCPPATRAAIRTSCQAGNGSGCRSPARWPCSPAC